MTSIGYIIGRHKSPVLMSVCLHEPWEKRDRAYVNMPNMEKILLTIGLACGALWDTGRHFCCCKMATTWNSTPGPLMDCQALAGKATSDP